MLVLDDLPGTGGIPQWVLDNEAAGHTLDAYEPCPPPHHRAHGLVGVVVVVAAVLALWSGRPSSEPDAQVAALAAEATMTQVGQQLFYAHHPQVLDAAEFAGRCPARAVGCYSAGAGSIVVYEPEDERLHGWVVTVASHEMLHAAYDSLDDEDRRAVDALLDVTMAGLGVDDPLRAQVEASVDGREDTRRTEQFAYIGSQVAGVDPRLEAFYGRFFDDRQAVVHAYTSTGSLLVALNADLAGQREVLKHLQSQGRTSEAVAQRGVVDSLAQDIGTLQTQMSGAVVSR
ncbi:MAG: hypothetical protein FWF21_06420 [Micrococcales bacterium]|nr:hypothetical protein [Micrococcales bacterium]